ncbi:LiaI-LiaF-like domain-containing protein [Clostridium amazonitimonense]|uniref:LiaI-LiaF-like domain-containing protein n=1 Tax=Clostridium amazonitimonense TaxID=1499689 RepID=UPI000509AAF0|nr:DUF5668 domain-containing protein [Clostridium amazonitimonense]
MKKVGSFTLALSLIFLGTVLITRQMDPVMANFIFKFWPSIFILLGIEYLITYSINKSENRRNSFNFGVLIMVLVFLVIEGIYGLKINMLDRFRHVDKGYVNEFNIDKFISGRKINISKEETLSNNNIEVYGRNANITLEKAKEGVINLQGDVYLKEDYKGDNYDVKVERKGDTILIKLDDDYIKSVDLVIQIPNGATISFDINNLQIKSEDDMRDTDIEIKGNNGNFNLDNFKSIYLKNNNCNVNVRNTKIIDIYSNNSKISVENDVEKLNIKSNISSIDIDGDILEEGKIDVDSGKISMNSSKKNKLDIELSKGAVLSIDNEKITGSTFKRDEGEGSLKVRTKVGIININQGKYDF